MPDLKLNNKEILDYLDDQIKVQRSIRDRKKALNEITEEHDIKIAVLQEIRVAIFGKRLRRWKWK